MKIKNVCLFVHVLSTIAFADPSDNKCAAYNLGESRVHSDLKFIGAIGGPTISYKATRLGENKYLLEVNPDFYVARPMTTALNTKQIEFIKAPGGRKIVEECFDWFNKTYSQKASPQIVLGLSEGLPSVAIRLDEKKNIRSFSRNYSQQTLSNCGAVVHESLHVMGLWDEYLEPRADGLFSFNCRSQSDSIMSNGYADLNPFETIDVIACACPVNDPTCFYKGMLLSSHVGETDTVYAGCPEGFVEVGRSLKDVDPKYPAEAFGPYHEINKTGVTAGHRYHSAILLPLSIKPQIPLRPAHLRQLLFPDCEDINPIYKACIQNAYRTKGTPLSCKAVPSVCGEKNKWLE